MSSGKRKRQIRKMVELLRNRYDVLSIFAEDIAGCLEYPLDIVEDQLQTLYEEGIIEPAWELPCGLCGRVVAWYELPELFRKGPMVGPCPGCESWLETDCLSQDNLVMAYHFVKSENELGRTYDHFAEIPGENYSPPQEVISVTSDWEGEDF